jgi:hypothetical protein
MKQELQNFVLYQLSKGKAIPVQALMVPGG